MNTTREATHIALSLGVFCALAVLSTARCAGATPAPECAEPSPLCAAILEHADGDLGVTPSEAVYECSRVEWWANKLGGDPALSIASAWIESKFDRDVVSRAGARGIMQVMPHHWCPNRTWDGCDSVREGVRALVELRAQYGPVRGISYYRAGRAGLTSERSMAKARRRIGLGRALKRMAWGLE